jgi:thiol:disulfide interchange protein DsbD
MAVVNRIFGVILLACALWIVSPLIPVSVQMDAELRALAFERVRSLDELEQRVASAGRPVMLDFYADWCVSCRQMERDTFADPRVREKLSGWRLLRADVTAGSPEDRALLARFRLFGPPGIVFFDLAGKELTSVRVVGYQPAGEFLSSLAATGM